MRRPPFPSLLPSALAVLLLLGPAGAAAFSVARTDTGQYMRWTTLTVGYYLDPDGSDDIANDSDVEAVRRSFQSWVDMDCSYLEFEELGPTTVTRVLPTGAEGNGKNELIWVENSTWTFGYYTLGVTSPLAYTNGQIVEADIAFNGYQQQWTTANNPSWDRTDVESVAVHEIGHLFGLQHNLYYDDSDPPTMAPTVDPYNRTRTPSNDDRMAICFLYPITGTYNCTSDGQCPYILDVNYQTGEEYYADKIDCVGGLCEGGNVGPQPAPPGAACASAYDCASYFCVANPTDAVKRCRESCRIDDPDCRTGETCYPLSGATGACLPEDAIPDTPKAGVGDPCARDFDCASNLCVIEPDGMTRLCRQTCTPGGSDCAADEACAVVDVARGACMPVVVVGPREDGAACDANGDCVSALCYFVPGATEATCRTACVPGTTGACAAGWSCVSYGIATDGVCMATQRATGALCTTGADCTTGMCLDGACVQSCVDGDCPCGTSCQSDPHYRTVCVLDPTSSCVPVGGSCATDAVCSSGRCVSGLCRAACRINGPACTDGLGCARRGDSLDGACVTPGALPAGSACADDLACASLLCVPPDSSGAAPVCLDVCAVPGAACESGGTCTLTPGLRFFGACVLGDEGGGGEGGADAQGGADGGGGGGSAGGGAGGGGGGGGCALGAAAGGPVAPAALLLLLALLLAPRAVRRAHGRRAAR